MIRKLAAAATALLFACSAFAANLNVRAFHRVIDPRNVISMDRLTWYAGESIEYIVRLRRGSEALALPANATVVWQVIQGDIAYLVEQGEITDAGHAAWHTPASRTALPPGKYTSWATAYQGDDYLGIIDRFEVEVRWRPGTDMIPIEPLANWQDWVMQHLCQAVAPLASTQQLAQAIADFATRDYVDGSVADATAPLASTLAAVAAVSGRVDVVEGWGNHAEAGYLTAESDTAALAAVAGVESNVTALAETVGGITAESLGALTEEAAEVLLAAATNIVVESVGGPLLSDFATAEFRVSGSGWGVAATGEAVNHGNVIARENTLGLRENFTIAFTNIRSSVEGVSPTATAGTNISNGSFSASQWDMAGNTATGLHWSAGVQSGAVGVVEYTLGSWTGQVSRIFPGYTATANVHEFLGFVPGSLRATVDADMLARNATGDINPFETTTTWPNLIRNTNVWTKDMDLTCVSTYNSLGSWAYSFTLVTPQHFVFASHWPRTTTNSSLIDGHALYFVDSTNGLHSREVVKARQVWLDCSVGLLDAPLPPSVTPAKIIDTNDFAKFKGVETLRPHSSLAGPSGMIGVHVRPTYARAIRVPFDPPTPDSNTYWWSSRDPNLRHSDTHSGTNYVGGESGSPVLLCIEGQTVIAQTPYTAGGAGPHIAALRPQIEATMATLGASAYTNLETINLAHWPDYP
jgi:hypothetical protein